MGRTVWIGLGALGVLAVIVIGRILAGEGREPARGPSVEERPPDPAARPAPVARPDPPAGVGSLRVIVTHARDGARAAGIAVEVMALADNSGGRRRRRVTTGSDGEASFAMLPRGPLKVMARDVARNWAVEPGARDLLEIAVGPELRPDENDHGPPGERVLRGAVVAEDRRPVAGAWVAAVGVPRRRVEASTDAAGRFEIAGLPDGPLLLEAWSEGFAPAIVETVAADAGVIVLGAGCALRGVVRNEHGAPLPRVRVGATRPDGLGGPVFVWTRDDGSFALDGVAAGRVRARAAFLAGAAAEAWLDVAGGETVTWNPVITCGTVLAVTVRDERGAPRPFTWVRAAARPGRGYWVSEACADEDGVVVIPNCADAPITLELEPPRFGPAGTWIVHDVDAGAGRIDVVVPESARPSSFVSGVLLAADGTPLIGAAVAAARRGHASETPFTVLTREPEGAFRIGPLAPGTHAFEVVLPSGATAPFAECALGPDEDVDLGERVVAREGFLKVLVTREAGAPATERLRVADREGRTVLDLRPVGGFAVSSPLGAGPYVLLVRGAGVRPEDLPFEVRPGETTTLDVVIRR